MKKIIIFLAGLVMLAGAVWGGIFYWKNLRGIGPALKSPPGDIARAINSTDMPLTLPPGFEISVFAKNVKGARVMAFDPKGNLWVSRTSEGAITILEIKNGSVFNQHDVLTGLRKPHGIAFDPQNPSLLFFAEEHGISKVQVDAKDTNGTIQRLIKLPYGDGHFTRTIGFGPDNHLYVSIGSSCNVCNEKDFRRAKFFSMQKDGTDIKEFARGLRNSVFFTWHPVTYELWATEMGRDLIGDDIPPDEVNIITEGKNYGWPICFGKNAHDTDFDKNTYIRNPCEEPFETQSYIDVPAHSAPLGLAFIPEHGWPEEYAGNLLVSYHGSWNRTAPTGYKIVRYLLDENGAYRGEKDFISGWLAKDGKEALGRPVDIIFGRDDAAYVSDDKAGVIYRISYLGK